MNEIASVALLPRNDGILKFFVMSSPDQVEGWHKAGWDDTTLVILEFLGNFSLGIFLGILVLGILEFLGKIPPNPKKKLSNQRIAK